MSKLLLLHRTFWISVLAATLTGVTLQPVLVWAQSGDSSSSLNSEPLSEPLIFNFSNQMDGFENTGRPARQTSTGSRSPGSCLNRLIALMPGSEPLITQTQSCSEPNSLLALTVDDTPTFWFYLPPELSNSAVSAEFVLSNSAETAEFVLLDQNHRPIHTEQVSLNGESGIIGVQLTHSLEVNQVHRWVFQVELTGEPGQGPAVEGFVERIQPDSALNRQLAAATSPQERIRAYAEHGVWHDALTEATALSLTHSNSATPTDWTSLLDSVGLGAIAHFPLLDCCTSQPVSD
ncbi:DUF928 domain-containing protein [Leptolyngbya sp. FACHB-671]|uniref:DUF928 domain-containing protein n=1 Tax=Leptolyngbya sp. FACHB-671 TaxID=2692812 RepID=UPI001685890B|nr:DUF928 domain-containing protein [Leptolyngbya sp. FACHB-671]MBD2066429.1 DUF928 domain-containing protein [Leptolyngbya sp. FACHB-671]